METNTTTGITGSGQTIAIISASNVDLSLVQAYQTLFGISTTLPQVVVDGTDVTEAIRGPEVSGAVSVVASNPGVRSVLVDRQRQWVAEHGGGIVEGRDIGAVVFPQADLKIYLTASAAERARRRPEEGAAAGARRDHLDSTRAVSPLEVADGARIIDTTDRHVADIVDEVVTWL